MFRPVLITPPAQLPVSTEYCRDHGVIDVLDNDTLFEGHIKTAVDYLDGFSGILGRCLVTQTWQVEHPLLCRQFVLPVPDVSNVAIVYDDMNGDEQPVPQAAVRHHPVAQGTLVRIASSYQLPSLEADSIAPVRVKFTAGYGGPDDVPDSIKTPIAQLARRLYDDRPGFDELRRGSVLRSLIALHRWVRV